MEMRAPKSKSSQVHSVGYDEATRTLSVRFHRGGTYTYHGVDAETFRRLHSAESVGGFLNSNIKGRFSHRRA